MPLRNPTTDYMARQVSSYGLSAPARTLPPATGRLSLFSPTSTSQHSVPQIHTWPPLTSLDDKLCTHKRIQIRRVQGAHRIVPCIDPLTRHGHGEESAIRGFAPLEVYVARYERLRDGICCGGGDVVSKRRGRRYGCPAEFDADRPLACLGVVCRVVRRVW